MLANQGGGLHNSNDVHFLLRPDHFIVQRIVQAVEMSAEAQDEISVRLPTAPKVFAGKYANEKVKCSCPKT